LFFAAATVLVFRCGGRSIGLLACAVALFGIARREFSEFSFINSWNTLNLPDSVPDVGRFILFAKLTIVSGLLIVFAALLSMTSLFAERWTARGSPIREKIWPAVLITVLVGTTWFAYGAIPYSVPMFHRSQRIGELYLIHIQRNGIRLHATEVSFWRDCRVFITERDGSLFHYRIHTSSSEGESPSPQCQDTLRTPSSPEFQSLPSSRIRPKRTWARNTWYVYSHSKGWMVFNQVPANLPNSLAQSFDQARTVPTQWQHSDEKDVCLGFCYDPIP
jgi:hypothetical protein